MKQVGKIEPVKMLVQIKTDDKHCHPDCPQLEFMAGICKVCGSLSIDTSVLKYNRQSKCLNRSRRE